MEFRGPIEAALTTDLRGEPYNFSLWDIHTGTQLVIFKGIRGNPIAKCLDFIDNNHFITANDNVLHIWSIFNKKCQEQKLILPARPTTLCVSPCGNYLSVGISEMIYVWQLHSGNLLAHTQRHYQTVSVLKMNFDGTFLFSAGEDGMVLVWSFADLISGTFNTSSLNLTKSRSDVGVNEPKYTWQHHSGQVTDIHITNSNRCLTSSIDMTINMYSYSDGRRLYCVSMPSPIWSIVMDKNETFALLGAQDGNIYEIAVSSLSLSLINQNGNSHKEPIFKGHKGKVNSLLISIDGTRLISASVDSSCKIWDIHQRKMLQDIKHQAPLANLTSLLIPDSLALSTMSQSHSQTPLSIKQLKRNIHKMSQDRTILSEDLYEESSTTIMYLKNSKTKQNFQTSDEIEKKFSIKTTNAKNNHPKENPNDANVINLKAKIRELYRFSAEKIFKDAALESLKQYKDLSN